MDGLVAETLGALIVEHFLSRFLEPTVTFTT